eukprot:60472_1
MRLKTEQKDNEEKNKTTSEYFDDEFSRLNKMIQERQHITKEFNRFSLKKNNKFNIQVENEEIKDESDDITFLDSLYQYLKDKNVSVNNMQKLHTFIQDEQYESDSIEYDVNIDGNIGQIAENKCAEAIKQFIKSIKISAASFSVGLRFYYWDHFKGLKQLPDEEQAIQEDICSYNIKDLFIVCKYHTFKEEISYYPYFTFKQYLEEVVVKVNKYISTKIVKKTKATT